MTTQPSMLGRCRRHTGLTKKHELFAVLRTVVGDGRASSMERIVPDIAASIVSMAKASGADIVSGAE